MLIEFIESNKQKDNGKVDDEATPVDGKRYPHRLSSERAKKRLK